MIYSKYLRHAHCAMSHNLIKYKFSSTVKSNILHTTAKISFCGPTIYSNKRQYSTILNPKFAQCSKPIFKNVMPLSLAASVSTDTSNVKDQVIFTNSAEETSSALNSSLESLNDIKSSVELPSSDIADIATSLTDELTSVVEVIEPSLSSVGLGHWTPAGLVQILINHLHVEMHWPWWMAIVTCTVIARILLFPLLLKTQKNAIHMANYMPQLQYLQAKFGEARRIGNTMEASRLANEMMLFMKEKNVSPLKNAMFPMLQAPVFLSFFFGLRGMAKAPVESMKEGGLWWVNDLTVPDPYYILPILSCSTMFLILKVGAESGIRMENLKLAKYLLIALPIVAFPFCMHFPSAVLYYWTTNNFCSLSMVMFLKIKHVRKFFKLPDQQPTDPRFVLPKKGFVKGVKDAFEDQKILAAVEDRRRVDRIKFQKAGTGPIPRTYSYNPTKPRPSDVASAITKGMAAKERKD